LTLLDNYEKERWQLVISLQMSGQFFSGTSGLVLPYKNKTFYPSDLQDRSRMAVYGLLNNSIEINSTFYKTPLPSTVSKWAEEVPDSFKFTFKLSREITHVPKLDFKTSDVDKFMDVINEVKFKKGCLLVQLPPSITSSSYHRLEELLQVIKVNDVQREWNVCVEFRHNSWYNNKVYALLARLSNSIVYQDKIARGISFDGPDSNVCYLRLHGPEGNFRSSYDDSTLAEYSYYIKDWLDRGKDVYVYFNNTMGNLLQNLKMLNHYLT
jgi:uncharacterized protein YecE (DUF72 family)